MDDVKAMQPVPAALGITSVLITLHNYTTIICCTLVLLLGKSAIVWCIIVLYMPSCTKRVLAQC